MVAKKRSRKRVSRKRKVKSRRKTGKKCLGHVVYKGRRGGEFIMRKGKRVYVKPIHYKRKSASAKKRVSYHSRRKAK